MDGRIVRELLEVAMAVTDDGRTVKYLGMYLNGEQGS